MKLIPEATHRPTAPLIIVALACQAIVIEDGAVKGAADTATISTPPATEDANIGETITAEIIDAEAARET